MNPTKDQMLHFDFKNARSLKIYPENERGPLKWFMFGRKHKIAKALNVCEEELAGMTMVANRRLDKIRSLINENVINGQHIVDEVFIPEYLGFTELAPEKIDDVRFYSKDGYSIVRVEGSKWLLHGPNSEKMVFEFPNMYVAITVLGSIGMDINIGDYMNGIYRKERDIKEVVKEVVEGILQDRQKLLNKKGK